MYRSKTEMALVPLITPTEYIDLFLARKTVDIAKLEGLSGRFIRGITDADLNVLCEEPHKRLAWVLNSNSMHSILGSE